VGAGSPGDRSCAKEPTTLFSDGPCLDIYVSSPRRSRDVIEHFLHAYVDVSASDDRGDEELMMVPVGYGGPLRALGRAVEWDWQPVGRLSEIIDLGLAQPPRAFAVYLEPNDRSLCGTVLAFTRDGRLILGLSVPEPTESREERERTESLLLELMAHARVGVGVIAVATPPPLDGSEFEEWVRNPDRYLVLRVITRNPEP